MKILIIALSHTVTLAPVLFLECGYMKTAASDPGLDSRHFIFEELQTAGAGHWMNWSLRAKTTTTDTRGWPLFGTVFEVLIPTHSQGKNSHWSYRFTQCWNTPSAASEGGEQNTFITNRSLKHCSISSALNNFQNSP